MSSTLRARALLPTPVRRQLRRLQPSLQRRAERISQLLAAASDPEVRTIEAPDPLGDLDPFTQQLWKQVDPYTLTSPERVASLVEATRYVTRHGIEGAFVECGVWRGGSALALVLSLLECGVTDRDIWLYDTFEAMPDPGDRDVDMFGTAAEVGFASYREDGPPPGFEYLPFQEVQDLLLGTGYPSERIHFIKGMVEETIPAHVPDKIALLRLDTDWYESTAHELKHLAPRVPEGGLLLIDDYGHWMGAKDATDEWLRETGFPLHLHRIDYTARMAVMRRS